MGWLANLADRLGEPVEHAAAYFLQGGGTTTPADWAELDSREMAALVMAGRLVRPGVAAPAAAETHIDGRDHMTRFLDGVESSVTGGGGDVIR